MAQLPVHQRLRRRNKLRHPCGPNLTGVVKRIIAAPVGVDVAMQG